MLYSIDIDDQELELLAEWDHWGRRGIDARPICLVRRWGARGLR